jgi:hypothetical protein
MCDIKGLMFPRERLASQGVSNTVTDVSVRSVTTVWWGKHQSLPERMCAG